MQQNIMFKKIAKIFFEGIKLKTKVFGPQIWWLSLNWGQKTYQKQQKRFIHNFKLSIDAKFNFSKC